MKIEYTAVGNGEWVVVTNGVDLEPTHDVEREAAEHAQNFIEDHPDAVVYYEPRYRVRVTAKSPEPVVVQPPPEPTPVITPPPDTFERGNGAVLFVDRSAGDGGSGSQDNPLSLKQALLIANPNDTIVVRSGRRVVDPDATWARAFSPARDGLPDAPIRIVSETPRGATIATRDEQGYTLPALSINGRSYIKVLNFAVEGVLKVIGEDNFPDGEGAPHGRDVGYCTLEGNDVQFGGPQGDDNSLNWGIAVHTAHFNVVRNNRVRNLINTGNVSENTGALMLFCSADNLIEFNDVDGCNNVCSAFGQKAGNCHRNEVRFNRGRRAQVGFTGKGGTAGDTFCDHNDIHNNIIEDCGAGIHLNHNSRYWWFHNNTVVRVLSFLMHGQLNSVANQYWNNIISEASYAGYFMEAMGQVNDWRLYIQESDYNLWNNVLVHARWDWGVPAYTTLGNWVSDTFLDVHSRSGDPRFVDPRGNYRLAEGSPAIGTGRDGLNIGAYATGLELIGTNW